MQKTEQEDLRPKHIGTIYESGSSNSKTCTIPKEYAQFIGVKEGTYIEIRPYCGKHGNYLVLHKQGEQPDGGKVEGVYISYNELKQVEG